MPTETKVHRTSSVNAVRQWETISAFVIEYVSVKYSIFLQWTAQDSLEDWKTVWSADEEATSSAQKSKSINNRTS